MVSILLKRKFNRITIWAKQRRTSVIVLVFSHLVFIVRLKIEKRWHFNAASPFPYVMLMINAFVCGFHYCHCLNSIRSQANRRMNHRFLRISYFFYCASLLCNMRINSFVFNYWIGLTSWHLFCFIKNSPQSYSVFPVVLL